MSVRHAVGDKLEDSVWHYLSVTVWEPLTLTPEPRDETGHVT
jgi:hypothetical protein